MQIKQEQRQKRPKAARNRFTKFGIAAACLVLVFLIAGACTIGGFSSPGSAYYLPAEQYIVYYLDFQEDENGDTASLASVYVNVGAVYTDIGDTFTLEFRHGNASGSYTNGKFSSAGMGKITLANISQALAEDTEGEESADTAAALGTNYGWVKVFDYTEDPVSYSSYRLVRVAASCDMLLYGISLIYGTVGTLYFADIPAHLDGSALQIMAFVFFLSGMGFKISLVPFHLWTADVYEGAPSTVTAYLSVISKGSAAFVLMAMLVKVFAPMVEQWQTLLYWIIIASITLANLFALRQENLKRLMAFSSISQAGYIMLGVIAGTAQGMTALVYYVLIYLFANLGVFAVITIVALRAHKFTLTEYNGLYTTNPRLAFLMTLCLFSLAGIPPFAGFFSKFFIFAAAFHSGFHLLVFIALANTVISLYYYLRVVKAMYINKSDEPIAAFRSDNYTRAALLICTLGITVLSIVSASYESIGRYAFGM